MTCGVQWAVGPEHGILDELRCFACAPWPWPGWLPALAAVVASFRGDRALALRLLLAGGYAALACAVFGYHQAIVSVTHDFPTLRDACLWYAAPVAPVLALSVPVLARARAADLADLYPWPAASFAAGLLASLIAVFGSFLLLSTPAPTLQSLFSP